MPKHSGAPQPRLAKQADRNIIKDRLNKQI